MFYLVFEIVVVCLLFWKKEIVVGMCIVFVDEIWCYY